ncbi:hypothetical protein [Cellulosilyticum ruminicola]|uniref:hypothetical protein n=1 Tax=Cellulosilyticum ruminicola TaxID=425254 RepID=UPI0006D19C9D|nr:hypothetical protein [Cellulosilyticum ruminicola]
MVKQLKQCYVYNGKSSKSFLKLGSEFQSRTYETALQSFMGLFVEHILALPSDITECIKGKVDERILSQTSFI